MCEINIPKTCCCSEDQYYVSMHMAQFILKYSYILTEPLKMWSVPFLWEMRWTWGLQKNGLCWKVNACNLLLILPPGGKVIPLCGVLSHLPKILVEIILYRMHRCNFLCREKSGWPHGGEFFCYVLDTCSWSTFRTDYCIFDWIVY